MAVDLARERRHRYLELALRRARPGTGSSMAFFRRRDWSELAVDLSAVRTPFVIVGAVATRLYMPERVTQDLDILIHGDDSPAFAKELETFGFTRTSNLSIGGSSWANDSGHGFYVIESSLPWVRDAVTDPQRSPDGLPVVRLPYLVILKMNASRGIDIGDLTRMLGLASAEAREEVRQIVRRFQPEDSDDLESLISLGELEFGQSGDPTESP